MKRFSMLLLAGLCLAALVFGVLTASSPARSAHAVSSPSPDVIVYYNGVPTPQVFSFGQCIPMRNLNGAAIDSLQVNSPAKASLFTDASCLNQVSPVPVVLLPGIHYPNVGNIFGTGTQSFMANSFP